MMRSAGPSAATTSSKFGPGARAARSSAPSACPNDRDLRGAGATMAGAIGLAVVDLELVMGVLDGRHPQPAPGELLDEAHGQRRLAGLLPAGNADDRDRFGDRAAATSYLGIMSASMARASSSSAGVLALKKGSTARPPNSTNGKSTTTVP